MKPYLSSLFLLAFYSLQAQLGSNCGIPSWNNTIGYLANSHVLHNASVYTNTNWSQNEEPNATNTNWVSLGSCNEQLIIDNPNLEVKNYQNVIFYFYLFFLGVTVKITYICTS